MSEDNVLATVRDAARAALEARRGGPAVAVAQAVPGAHRLLVFQDGRVLGRLADPALQDRAVALARESLDNGAAASEYIEDTAGQVTLYAEPHQAIEELVIVGAGHIAMPLARLGVLLGFRVVVLDDREAFATVERFPDAADVRRVDFSHPFDGLALGRRSYVVLVTRAHRYDYDCLRQLTETDRPLAYLGMVGSRRRVRATFESLQENGVPRERLAAVHSPIGLDIGAETPEEIALSIAAELVAVRRRVTDGAGAPLAGKERVLERLVPSPSATDHHGPSSGPGGGELPGQVPVPSRSPGSQPAPEPAARHAAQSQTTDPDALVYSALLDAADAGRTAVLATVVSARGSTPRRAGSKMLIEPDGTLVGTIGGGCGEGEVIAASRDVAATGRPRVVRVDLTDDTKSWSAAICGGVMEVLLETIDDR
jgi:xanthine dehydrogenase accessory factor